MRRARTVLYCCLLPLLGGCQLFAKKAPSPKIEQVRLQGELSVRDGEMVLRPCDEQRHFVLTNTGNIGLAEEVRELQGGGSDSLFADVRGAFGASKKSGVDGRFELNRLYRLERGGRSCNDPDFRHMILRAAGNEPFWSVSVGARGLLLQRSGQPPLALPYLEEQVPGGTLNLTSEANSQHLELWVTPQRCVDAKSGAIRHLSAELRLDGLVQHGCAYLGGGRED